MWKQWNWTRGQHVCLRMAWEHGARQKSSVVCLITVERGSKNVSCYLSLIFQILNWNWIRNRYSSLTKEKAAEIALFYHDGLATLHPGGFQKLYGFAQEWTLSLSISNILADNQVDRNKILGFHQLDATSINLLSYATSLIITRDDFSIFQHCDKDEVDLAYGLWWAGLWDDLTKRYVLSDDCNYDQISGGSFFFSEYGYGIQFEKLVFLCSHYYLSHSDYFIGVRVLSRLPGKDPRIFIVPWGARVCHQQPALAPQFKSHALPHNQWPGGEKKVLSPHR